MTTTDPATHDTPAWPPDRGSLVMWVIYRRRRARFWLCAGGIALCIVLIAAVA